LFPVSEKKLLTIMAFLMRGVAFFEKACFGLPSPSKRKNISASANAFGAPIRPRHLVPTQQGVGTITNYNKMKKIILVAFAENPGNVALAK
jgi:hypothetical protein